MSLLRWMCVLALACALGGCGDDSGGDGDNGDAAVGDGDGDEELPMPVSEEVSADEGADIETQGGAISIPGGALAEDTEVTVEVILPNSEPDADKLVSLIYDFGPDGTTFEMPVELTIEMNDDVPEGMEAKMAWLDEDADRWVVLEDSHVDGDSVIATTTHFTKFAIVLTSSGQTGGTCEQFDSWEPCGGDIEGTWEFSLGCADLGSSFTGEGSPFGNCAGLVASINLDISGTVTFEAGGDYAMDITRETEIDIALPTSCLMAGAMCSDYAGISDGASAELNGDVCNISFGDPAEMESEMGTYELQGSSLTLMDSATPDDTESNEYCVDGNTITVRFVDVNEETGEETVAYLQATRQ